jgi:oxaloacetate decarboxylase gamma subunit
MLYNDEMNISDLLAQGAELMILGMGMVFFILSLLIIVIKSVTAITMRYDTAPVSNEATPPRINSIDEDVVVAITIAVERFRSK